MSDVQTTPEKSTPDSLPRRGFIASAVGLRSYSCSLTANGRARTGAGYTASSGNMQAAYETATGTTLTSFRSTVGGPIPR